MFDEKDAIANFLSNLDILNSNSRLEQIKIIVQRVARIPWGNGRSIEDVFTRGVGTCTGKHKVLQACFDQLEIKYKPVVTTFRWMDQTIKYPQHIKKILNEGSWLHGHNFIQLEDGIDIDVIFNPELKPFGFKTFPEEWDGRTSFVGFDNIIKRWNDADLDNMKSQLIETLSTEQRERRQRFLDAFIEWVETINNGMIH